MPATENLTVRMPPDLLRQLAATAHGHDRTIAGELRRIVRLYLENSGAAPVGGSAQARRDGVDESKTTV